MKEKRSKIDRRDFLKTIGAVGFGSVFTDCKGEEKKEPNAVDPNAVSKTQETKVPQVPKRTLGKTGVEVSCLGMGAMFNLVDNQVIIRSAIKYGINYWDTAYNYAQGNSELGIGKYLENNPDDRKNLFIVTKASGARTVEDVEARLQESLKRMHTDYVDAYFPHGISSPEHFTDELRQWVEGAKKRKLIRHFGFSTHSNMAKMLITAVKIGWVDMVMMTYNFRLLENAEMQEAIALCHKAKIGLVAMKTAGRAVRDRKGQKTAAEADEKLMKQLLERGFTQEQAAIKLVLDDKRISCACVGMETIPILSADVAAVLDKTELTAVDKEVFNEYARSTCSGYCAGCADICGSVLPGAPYVSDIMRSLMYYNSYGKTDWAKQVFAQIPRSVRNKLLSTDFSVAESLCPQHLRIGELIAEAVEKLA